MTALRYKTYPEILASMFARARRKLDTDVDLVPGSVIRTILECAAFSDADQYVQLALVEALFALDRCKGDDLDRRALDYGADIFPDLRRRPANTSVAKISVGDGTLIKKASLALDANLGSTSVTGDDLSAMPTSGYFVIDRATDREEAIIATRVGDVLTLVSPTTLAKSHSAGAKVELTSTRSTLNGAIIVGATSCVLATGTGAAWPASGNIIFDRNTVAEEKKAFTRVGDTLTFSATAFAHADKAVIILGTFGSNRAIASGLTAFVPATESTKQIDFRTTTAGTLFDGDFTSGLVDVESVLVGLETRAGGNQITKWVAPPFSGATVTNPAAATRGSDREKDDPYRQRIKDFIQSLTRATPLSIVTAVSGARDPETGQEVAFAQIVEPVAPGASDLFITDGTSSFSLGQAAFIGRDVLIRDAEAGDKRGKLSKFGPYGMSTTAPTHPRLFKSITRGVGTSVGANFLEDSSQSMVVNEHVGRYLKTDDDQFFLITANTAIRFTLDAGGATPSLGSYSVFNFSVAPLVVGTDFTFNEATGDVELATALVAHDGLVAASDGASPSIGAYLYSTGLAAYVQRLVNGDATDFSSFPGLRASGTKVVVKVPTTVSRSFTLKVVAARGFSDDQIRSPVQVAVQTYVNSLGIGDNVILSEIVRLVKGLPGVDDVTVIDPSGNFVVAAGTLIRITDTDVLVA